MASKEKKTVQTKDMISDVEKLFRYSGMVDRIRDAARVLVENVGEHVERGEASVYVGSYQQLRESIAANLRKDIAAEMLEMTPDLDPETARASEVYFAAEILSAYADLIYQTPKFLLSEQAQALGMKEFRERIAKGSLEFEQRDEDDEAGLTVPQAGLGQYL